MASMDEISTVFQQIPVSELLAISRSVREELKTDLGTPGQPGRIELKDGNEPVTPADLEIQKLLLRHFASSPLSGNYVVRAEETIAERPEEIRDPLWQLVIDPLDGTAAFCKGDDEWGTMVGLCDLEGRLIYSWNMISSGAVYSSGHPSGQQLPAARIPSWRESLRLSGSLAFDVYDYGGSATGNFATAFEKISGGEFKRTDLRLSSLPAAVLAGWELYHGRLNGLVWLPGGPGTKGCYPDYDLVFLGALANRGWRSLTGRAKDRIELVIVAPGEAELELLRRTALSMLSEEKANALTFSSDLQITGSLAYLSIFRRHVR